jgi:hypothetical protein
MAARHDSASIIALHRAPPSVTIHPWSGYRAIGPSGRAGAARRLLMRASKPPSPRARAKCQVCA